jgi:hypothetical protein
LAAEVRTAVLDFAIEPIASRAAKGQSPPKSRGQKNSAEPLEVRFP